MTNLEDSNELAISCRRARKRTLKARWQKSAVLLSPCGRSSSSSSSKRAPRPKPTRYLLACELSYPAIGSDSLIPNHQDLIRQAAYLKEAAHVGTETVKLLKRAWEEMLDTSVLAANIKHMIRLCVLAAGNVFSSSGAQQSASRALDSPEGHHTDKANGMRETMAKRLKRRCLRLGKACESLMRGVRQGVEVDDQFEKLVLALSEWLAALNKAHQDIRLVR